MTLGVKRLIATYVIDVLHYNYIKMVKMGAIVFRHVQLNAVLHVVTESL